MQPTTKPYTGPPGVQVAYLGYMPATQGGPCAYTSSSGQVMPGTWDSTFGCTPILQAPGITTTQTTTTSYVPWIIGAAAVVLAVVLIMTR